MVLPWQLGAAPSWPSSLSAVLSSQLTSITSDCSLCVIRLPRGQVLSRSSPHLQRLAHSYSRKCSLSGKREGSISAQIASGARTQPEQVPTREAHFPGGAALSSQFCAPPCRRAWHVAPDSQPAPPEATCRFPPGRGAQRRGLTRLTSPSLSRLRLEIQPLVADPSRF